MVFLITFLSINKKVIAWRLLIEGSGVYKGLSLVIETRKASPSVPLHLERDDLSRHSFGIVIELDPRLRGDDSVGFRSDEFSLSLSKMRTIPPLQMERGLGGEANPKS
jgi:hypothetical protein